MGPGVDQRAVDRFLGRVVPAHHVNGDPDAAVGGRAPDGAEVHLPRRRPRPSSASGRSPGGHRSSRSSDRRDGAASSRGSAGILRAAARQRRMAAAIALPGVRYPSLRDSHGSSDLLWRRPGAGGAPRAGRFRSNGSAPARAIAAATRGGRRASLARLGVGVDPERAERLEARVERRSRHGRGARPRAALRRRAQARAVGPAERGDRLGQLDRLADRAARARARGGRSAGRSRARRRGRAGLPVAMSIAGRASSSSARLERQLDRLAGSGCIEGEGRLEAAADEDAPVRPAEADPPADRLG